MKGTRSESVAISGFVLSVTITVISVIVLFPIYSELAQVFKTLADALHVVSTVN